MTKEFVIETAEQEKILNELRSLFNGLCDDDFSIDKDEQGIKVKVISIDFLKFENVCATGIKDENLMVGTKHVIEKLLKELSEIKSYGLKNGKRLYVGYNDERKVHGRKIKEQKRQQFYYTKDNKFLETNNKLPAGYENKIICADSYSFLKKLPDNCVDIVLTSPPYNFGLNYENSQDDDHWNEYFRKLFAIFSECVRVLKYGGRLIVNIQPLFSDYIPTHHIVSKFFMDQKLIWKGEILWEKNNYNCKYTAWGSWKSPSNPYLKYTWEFIEIFCKGDLKKKGDASLIDISADDFKKWVVGKWSIAPERNMKKYGHPAMFPEELVKRALQLFSYKGDVVLDPFNGAGTTTYVAKCLERKYLGVDVSEEYCKVAQDRLDSTLF